MNVTNYTAGPRGVNLKNGDTLWIEPGQTVDLDKSNVVGDLPDFGKAPDADAQNIVSLVEAQDQIARLIADNDRLSADNDRLTAALADAQAASSKLKPVGLTGKGKDALLKIAADEGVEKAIGDDGAEIAIADATNAQIVQAIEAKREAA